MRGPTRAHRAPQIRMDASQSASPSDSLRVGGNDVLCGETSDWSGCASATVGLRASSSATADAARRRRFPVRFLLGGGRDHRGATASAAEASRHSERHEQHELADFAENRRMLARPSRPAAKISVTLTVNDVANAAVHSSGASLTTGLVRSPRGCPKSSSVSSSPSMPTIAATAEARNRLKNVDTRCLRGRGSLRVSDGRSGGRRSAARHTRAGRSPCSQASGACPDNGVARRIRKVFVHVRRGGRAAPNTMFMICRSRRLS
jgi:hypothetical protein